MVSSFTKIIADSTINCQLCCGIYTCLKKSMRKLCKFYYRIFTLIVTVEVYYKLCF